MVTPTNDIVIAKGNSALAKHGYATSKSNVQGKPNWQAQVYVNLSMEINLTLLKSGILSTAEQVAVTSNCGNLMNYMNHVS